MNDHPLNARLSLDLEIGKRDARIHALAAVRADTDERLVFPSGSLTLTAALTRLDRLADGADFLLGHNLIAFDLAHLRAAKPDLRLLKLPAVDTLQLSPLAFPRNPYHHLVKHYQDGLLKRGRINDPELDARLALEVFRDQRRALSQADPELLTAWHWLSTADNQTTGCDLFFSSLRNALRPTDAEAYTSIHRRLADAACQMHARENMATVSPPDWPLAYVLAWLSVAGGNSVIPPWVKYQFPQTNRLLQRLRNTACSDPGCAWCRERHDARKELKRWFGFVAFRPVPEHDGRPMQQAIVEAVMARRHVLGILPTGTGKSLCYQIPALSGYDKTGALTVVISPLVALMADQVTGLQARGITSCVAINGLLSMPERRDALDKVRLGDAGIVLISPEQLRNRTLRKALDQREIGGWVLDEAHCLSKWGQDFRPDYRYISRFIRDKAGDGEIPPILCLTATAKPAVIAEVVEHFKERLGIELDVFDGGAARDNLSFEVIPTSGGEKFALIHDLLSSYLPGDQPGGAIVYCASRHRTEQVAEFLRNKDVSADHFHAGLTPDTKKDVQQRFINGELKVIAATNAFGMGIDKPDVRLVIHADIPASLENYLQEAGRAGRDREAARCLLFYARNDVESQFGLSARSRLSQREIHGILRALRNLDRKKQLQNEVVATVGEILREDEDNAFARDATTDDTRVKTAVAWLEESHLLSREENRTEIFPSALRIQSIEEAQQKLEQARLYKARSKELLTVTSALMEAPVDGGITTDELMSRSGLSAEEVRSALHDLESLGIARNDMTLTAFVHKGIQRDSLRRFEQAAELEDALISHLQEAAPDQEEGQSLPLHLRATSQRLRDAGVPDPLPERLSRVLKGIAQDGRGEGSGKGSLRLRTQDAETVWVTLQRRWRPLQETAELRRSAAKRLLEHLIGQLPAQSRGADLLAETTMGGLFEALKSDMLIYSRVRNPSKLLDHALLWLHDLEIVRLHRGLAVFRPAMTIRLAQERRGFTSADFEPLALHYKGQVLQIHIMVEFAERGLQAVSEALRLAMDYFTMEEAEFLERWLPGRRREIERETTPESYAAIVSSLNSPVQQRIVADNREQTNVLVLAGPGAGKTRVLVHRIAYLIRVRRQPASGILALAYNRHAAVEIRRRLHDLVGRDAYGVTVLTCHALAMRLVGASFTGMADQPDDQVFRDLMKQATALLRGEGLLPEEADAQRDRLLRSFRWILVDEYQDIGPEEYGLISALAGRTLEDEGAKLSLFAVGDDDQNIYAFAGASVAFIRRFEDDYRARTDYLTDNYRSTHCIIDAANALIEPARQRMKDEHPIQVDRHRRKEPPGGDWRERDPVGQGRVQILDAGNDALSQARLAVTELQRLAALDTDWSWSRCAVIARNWKWLESVRACCDLYGIPSQMANEEIPGFWRLRETQAFVTWVRERSSRTVDGPALQAWAQDQNPGPWQDLLRQAIEEYVLEDGGAEAPVDRLLEWLAEWGRDVRRRQQGLLLLTAHRAKGLEFDHVVVLDGGWQDLGRNRDTDEERRLYYVAMTRARDTLALMRFKARHPLQETLADSPAVLRRAQVDLPAAPAGVARRLQRLSLAEVDLGFAGRRGPGHSVQCAIGGLSPGDLLQTRITETGHWELLNPEGTVVGRLARRFEAPAGMRCVGAAVFAVLTRSRVMSDPPYLDRLKCETWEVVVPELMFEPAGEPSERQARIRGAD